MTMEQKSALPPSRAPYVVGIGICTYDHLFRISGLPVEGQRSKVDAYAIQGGGMVPTALVTLQRLGVDSSFVGITGDDKEGDHIRIGLEEEGVDTEGVITDPGTLSRVTLVLVDSRDGERTFIPRKGTHRNLTPADLDSELISRASALHLDDADPTALAAAQLAHEAGVPVFLDATWQNESMVDLLPLVDVAIAGERFAADWSSGATPKQVATDLVRAGARIGVVTLGSKGGVAVYSDLSVTKWSSFKINVVDTTGAGDSFHGAFIYGVLQKWGLEESLHFAAAVGAMNCLRLGGRTGLPSRDDVDQFLLEYS